MFVRFGYIYERGKRWLVALLVNWWVSDYLLQRNVLPYEMIFMSIFTTSDFSVLLDLQFTSRFINYFTLYIMNYSSHKTCLKQNI